MVEVAVGVARYADALHQLMEGCVVHVGERSQHKPFCRDPLTLGSGRYAPAVEALMAVSAAQR